jgi:flagellar motor protein MotB
MKKIFTFFLTVSAVALLGGCVSMEEYDRTVRMLETEQHANTAMAAENARLEGEVNRLRSENSALERSLEDIKVAAANTPTYDEATLVEKFQQIWGSGLRSSEWEYVQSGGAVGVRMDDSGVLFRSGSWDLTDQTKARLKQLADTLKGQLDNPNMFVRVDGHTDSDPIRRLREKGIESNVHLSSMRAMAVRTYMVQQGLPADRVFVAGFGEHWPVNKGNTARDKQRNRRVEIYLGDADALSIGSLPGPHVQR